MNDIIRLSDPAVEDRSYGFLVDISGIQFSDGSDETWIQAMPIGTWHHPKYGPIEITSERISRFADNVNNQVLDKALDVDYEHKEGVQGTKAAGWIKQARSDAETGLWLLVEWTKNAAQMIRDKEFRYFSPEYVDSWEHPSTKQKFKDVLFGGGLTNRPFLKGILPINLSEITSGGNMNRAALEKLAKKHDIEFEDSTSDEDLSTKVEEAVIADESDSGNSTDTNGDGDGGDGDNQGEDTLVTASDTNDAEIKKLAENNPVIAKLLKDQEAATQRLSVLEAANRLAETQVKLTELKNGKVVLTPVAEKKLSELMINPNSDAALDFAKSVLNGGTVELGERGGSDTESNKFGEGGATATFQAEVKKLTDGENGMEYVDAVEKVSQSNPDLWEAHRQQTFAGGVK